MVVYDFQDASPAVKLCSSPSQNKTTYFPTPPPTQEYDRSVTPEQAAKTFRDVHGCPEALEELSDIVEYLRDPSKFTRLGGRLPKVRGGMRFSYYAIFIYVWKSTSFLFGFAEIFGFFWWSVHWHWYVLWSRIQELYYT